MSTSEAAGLLKHYIRYVLEASGGTWNSDNDAEVDAIFEPIRALELRVDALERTSPTPEWSPHQGPVPWPPSPKCEVPEDPCHPDMGELCRFCCLKWLAETP